MYVLKNIYRQISLYELFLKKSLYELAQIVLIIYGLRRINNLCSLQCKKTCIN